MLHHKVPCGYMYRCLSIILLCVTTASAFAEEQGAEAYDTGWQLNIDNDLLTGQSTDRDYTGGIALILSGKRAQEYPVSIDSWRAGLDYLLSFPDLYRSSDSMSFHSQQYGMTLFTPEDIDSVTPVYDDRPYASLFFMSNTEFTVVPEKNKAYISILSIGFLGLELGEDVQRGIHDLTDSDVPNGWQHQVSSGGEPTAMLTYGVQNYLFSSAKQQLKLEYGGNLGFITDVNAGFSWRWGRINSPWWTFNPSQSKYMQQAMPIFSSNNNDHKNEFYLWAGARLNLRIYNALLQGQFRHSEVTVSSDDMERLVAEYWFGVTREFDRKYQASIFLRGHSDEFKGPNTRSAAWVGLVFTRTY
jgi:hypothetical protein